MNEQRGNWYLLTGVLIGVAGGLLVGWFPVRYTDTEPSALSIRSQTITAA